MPAELVSIIDFGDNLQNIELCKKRMAQCSQFALTVFLAVLDNWEMFTTELLAKQMADTVEHIQGALDELIANRILNIKVVEVHE
ncbi:hypothetical protein [Paucilactobacillus nenjiangensis]|jgi:hypothetical protein|uniref:hypothetical protein n=1 Tax=Paucilactobacillus nenjiangensis TaxID=1296540 RepID=UPI003BB1FE84